MQASHGQDRTVLIQVSSSGHQHVTIAGRRSPDSKSFEKWRVAQKQNSVEPKPNGFISKPLPLYDVSEDTPPQDPRKTIRVQCHCQVSNSIPIKILRDSGASQSLMLSDTLVLSEKLSTGVSVLFHI